MNISFIDDVLAMDYGLLVQFGWSFGLIVTIAAALKQIWIDAQN